MGYITLKYFFQTGPIIPEISAIMKYKYNIFRNSFNPVVDLKMLVKIVFSSFVN